VWAAVMSRPTEHRAIVDAGLEALAYRLSSFCPLASMAGFG
jgi:D-serine deaminase-like pyridoxal phosphate-dependent protein